jgi:hypothetical protein
LIYIAVGKQSKFDKTQEAINSAPVVDTNININIQKIQIQKEEKKYKCICCGDSWDAQKNHFSMSKSVLYQSNNNYIDVCNDCRDKYYYQLIDLYSGSEEKAIEHMCKQFGWIFNIDALESSRQVSADRSRISHYLAKKNLPQTTQYGYTDIDTIKNDFINRKENIIESKEHLEILKANGVTNSSSSTLDRWGGGLTKWDYETLDDHYQMIKNNNPNCDNNQEIFIKALCNLNWLMMKTLRSGDGDSDKYVKLTEQYSKTFKQTGLKTIEEKDSSNDEVFGVTLATISQYTPEEYYQNKQLYEDYDEIGDYIDRHMTRPLKNLQLDSTDRDFEFFVPDNEEELDEDE